LPAQVQFMFPKELTQDGWNLPFRDRCRRNVSRPAYRQCLLMLLSALPDKFSGPRDVQKRPVAIPRRPQRWGWVETLTRFASRRLFEQLSMLTGVAES